MRGWAILGVGVVLTAALSGPTTAAPAYEGNPLKFERIERDVVYGHGGGVPLTMDLFHPVPARKSPVPVVIFIHGGGWKAGDKRNGYGAGFAGRGYLYASINYRLAPQHRFPAPLEDVKCAIRYLRAHAAQYHLDPKRIGLWGNSAGSHLALLAAFTPGRYEGVGGWTKEDSGVQAVVDMFGPTDLVAPAYHPEVRALIVDAFGKSPATWREASPLHQAQAGAPPVQIWHGRHDTVVPPSQSAALHTRLIKLGVPSEFQLVENAGHGFTADSQPSADAIDARIDAFFDRHLLSDVRVPQKRPISH